MAKMIIKIAKRMNDQTIGKITPKIFRKRSQVIKRATKNPLKEFRKRIELTKKTPIKARVKKAKREKVESGEVLKMTRKKRTQTKMVKIKVGRKLR